MSYTGHTACVCVYVCVNWYKGRYIYVYIFVCACFYMYVSYTGPTAGSGGLGVGWESAGDTHIYVHTKPPGHRWYRTQIPTTYILLIRTLEGAEPGEEEALLELIGQAL